ncbi:hypothetical protein B1R94_10210 [Mycolicibacterium litorale]|nr:hypothetical protein B1R94_10210 [Mycolicibacterium litorale]
MAAAFTHVVKSNGGELVSQIGRTVTRERFAAPLRRRDGQVRWGFGLFPLPPDRTYDDMLASGEEFTEYLQAGGSADALTIELRKAGGAEVGCEWVRYVVGHPHIESLPLDTEITLGTSTLYVNAAEVFDAEEAADIFLSYHQSGAIPETYSLRPVEGYRRDGSRVDLGDNRRVQ